jgi:hypothetical protein
VPRRSHAPWPGTVTEARSPRSVSRRGRGIQAQGDAGLRAKPRPRPGWGSRTATASGLVPPGSGTGTAGTGPRAGPRTRDHGHGDHRHRHDRHLATARTPPSARASTRLPEAHVSPVAALVRPHTRLTATGPEGASPVTDEPSGSRAVCHSTSGPVTPPPGRRTESAGTRIHHRSAVMRQGCPLVRGVHRSPRVGEAGDVPGDCGRWCPRAALTRWWLRACGRSRSDQAAAHLAGAAAVSGPGPAGVGGRHGWPERKIRVGWFGLGGRRESDKNAG